MTGLYEMILSLLHLHFSFGILKLCRDNVEKVFSLVQLMSCVIHFSNVPQSNMAIKLID